jgi:signal transduction histidine kinase
MGRELLRIDAIVRSLLAYARPQEEELQAIEPGAAVRSAFALLQAQGALKSVNAELDLAGALPMIRGRAHLLEQTLVNLVLNAVDAAPGGRVVVGARPWTYEPGKAASRRASDAKGMAFSRAPARRAARAEFSAGTPGALVFVADSGPGVATADRERVFDPFFTTKPPGRGTGLGLALVARAVHDMEGVAWVDRAREGGAAFKLFFPEVRISAAITSQ